MLLENAIKNKDDKNCIHKYIGLRINFEWFTSRFSLNINLYVLLAMLLLTKVMSQIFITFTSFCENGKYLKILKGAGYI